MIAPHPVILVDDDPEVRASLSFWLEAEGFVVRTYANAASLLEAGFWPNAVLIVDEHLAEGSGTALVQKLQADGLQGPAIMITSNPTRALKDFCALSGMELVEKPFLSDSLLQALQNACQRMARWAEAASPGPV